MKRFASDDGNEDRHRPVPTQRNGEDTSPVRPFGGVSGGKEFSRGEAMRLLGGSLVGAALLPSGLARTVLAATLTSTYQALVKRALSSQTDLIEEGEHCSADPEMLETIGRAGSRFGSSATAPSTPCTR